MRKITWRLQRGSSRETGVQAAERKSLSHLSTRRRTHRCRPVRFHVIGVCIASVMMMTSSRAVAEGVWTRIGPRGGGVLIRAMAVDPVAASTVYACTVVQGVHKSTDGGANWRKLTRGLEAVGYIKEIVVDPNNHENLYLVHDNLATPTALSASRDGGANWKLIGTGFPADNEIFDLEVDPRQTGHLYAGMYDGVYKSEDGGRTWTAANRGLGGYRATQSIVASQVEPGTVYAAILDRVLKSQDAGQTWKPTASGLPLVETLIASPDGDNIIYAVGMEAVFKTDDGGASWTKAFTFPSDAEPVNTVAFVAGDPRALFIGTDTGLYKTGDRGEHWASAHTGMEGILVKVIVTHPHATAIMYAGTSCGIYRTGDGAGHWMPRNTGLNYTHYFVTQALILDSIPRAIVVGTDGCGIFESTDEGSTWEPLNNGLTRPRITALAADPSDPETRYAGTRSGEIFKTADGGAHWTDISAGLPGQSVSGLAVDLARPNRLYLGTWGGGLFVSSDSGRSWQKAGGAFSQQIVTTLALDPSNPDTLYVATFDDYTLHVFKSTDRGRTWSQGDSGLHGILVTQLAISPANSDIVYAGAVSGLYRSTDGGRRWRRLSEIPSRRDSQVNGLALDPVNPGVMYVSVFGIYESKSGVYRSSDGGDTWKLVREGLERLRWLGPLVIDPRTTDLVYAATDDALFVRSFAQ
ncbi:MAG: hypothetical protein HYX75_24120 [Acidobacteria bacterium]|nr:hypothetical protein [Acidobacteriota bacterium]